MSEDWQKPMRPLLGPVASEAFAMSRKELEHLAKLHSGPVKGCPKCETA